MKDLLLIEAPHSFASEEKVEVPPLGLAYMAACAEKEGFTATITDLNLGSDGLIRNIKSSEVIGVSCYTQNYHQALDILRIAKRYDKTVLVGGPHATSLYKEALEDGFDYVVRGEGERPLLNLLRGNRDLKGLAYRENGRSVVRPVQRVKDLDALPLPARHLLDLEKYAFPGAISTTRGCHYRCIFCSSRNQSGRLRARSVESLETELQHLLQLGVESFFVIDPNFAFDKKRTHRFCNVAKELGMNWFAELRLNHMEGDVIKDMGDSGCRVVRFGIESGSQRIVDLIQKGISLKRLEDVIRSFRQSGIVPVCGFMIGHPTETRQDFEKTLALVKKIKSWGGEATFAIQTPYPGTYLYKNSEKLGIKILSREWRDYHHLNPVLQTKNFSADELRELLFHALLELSETRLPKINNFKEEGDEIIRLADGIRRKSFRSICSEVL